MRKVVIAYLLERGPQEGDVRSTIDVVAAGVADLKGLAYAGVFESDTMIPRNVYLVPSDTLTCCEADRLGIGSPDDVFGGVVSGRYMGTKIICHELIGPHARHPIDWPAEFADLVSTLTLPGYAAFSFDDAMIGGTRLLSMGPVRIKNPLCASGAGQIVIFSTYELERHLNEIGETMPHHGVVLELNLWEMATLNVGRIAVDEYVMSYYGLQRMTLNNEGLPEYGGSALYCVMGGWGALLDLPMQPDIRRAVAKAVAFDGASAALPAFFASRRNYDVAIGKDDIGCQRSGVLEASWRAGGASTAEIVALKRLICNPHAKVVTVSAVREFGRTPVCPSGAIVHFRGNDPITGPVLRYTIVTGEAHKPVAPPTANAFIQ